MIASMAQAQASRTWVSGVGDDVNPCSRTAPCKTWAGAFSKTAAGGEIDALDSAGYGVLTINKAITIDGGPGNNASIATGASIGFNVVAAATDRVLLRNVTINGMGSGTTGIKITSAKSVTIENVSITGMVSGVARGIDAQCNSACRVLVIRSRVDHSGGIGMVFQGTVAGAVTAEVVDSSSSNNASHGIFAANGANVTLTNVVSSENAIDGLVVDNNNTRVSVLDSTFVNNTAAGVQAGTAAAVTATVGLSRTIISGNTPGVQFSGGIVQTHQNNAIRRNTPDLSGGALSPVSTQ
jgi:hypothetical protein